MQCVLRMLHGAAPQEAIDAPRLAALPDLVRLEPGFFSQVIASLEADNYQAPIADHRDPYFGGVSALSPRGGGADPAAAASSSCCSTCSPASALSAPFACQQPQSTLVPGRKVPDNWGPRETSL